MNVQSQHMSYVLELAQKGRGFVSPNPLVGCIIVKEGKIIGEGYHKKYGEHHKKSYFCRNWKPWNRPRTPLVIWAR